MIKLSDDAVKLNENQRSEHVCEPALLILWEKCSLDRDVVHKYLRAKFGKVTWKIVKWSHAAFSSNLTRFYGQKMPPCSDKELHIGNGAFDVFIFESINPTYKNRITSGGLRSVNTNLFDLKSLLRDLDGGGHKIHCTIDAFEGERDTWLLFAATTKELLTGGTRPGDYLERDLIGSSYWTDITEVLMTLNKCVDYVVLRNFGALPYGYDLTNHGDIDFLVSDLEEAAHVLNAQKIFLESYRVHYSINVNGSSVPIDLRSLDDEYYDPYWSRDILQSRVFSSGFFIPNEEQHFYSLLYHALIHKKFLSNDYNSTLQSLAGNIGLDSYSSREALEILNKFMTEKNYLYTRPEDQSVYFAWHKIKLIDQASYLFQIEARFLRQAILGREAKTKREHEYKKITFGPLTDRLGDFYDKIGCDGRVTAVICPQFDTDFEKLMKGMARLFIYCTSGDQKKEYQRIVQRYPQAFVVNFPDDSDFYEDFDLAILPNTLDLIPVGLSEKLISAVSSKLKPEGIFSFVSEQLLHIDQIIPSPDTSMDLFTEEIQGRPNSVNRYRVEFPQLFDVLESWGFGLVSQFGVYPDCNEPTYICNTADQRTVHPIADMVSAVGPHHPDISKVAVFQTLEKQIVLPFLFKGQVYNFSKVEQTSRSKNFIFAKYSIRDHNTSTITVARRSELGAIVEKNRICGNQDRVHNVIVHLENDLQVNIEHHSNFDVDFIPGKKLSTVLENSLLVKDRYGAITAFSLWGKFISQKCNLVSSIGTIWEKFDEYLVEGEMFDIGPHNIIVSGSSVYGIDDEWRASTPIPLCWYIARNSQACANTFSRPELVDFNVFIQQMYRILGLNLNTFFIEKSLSFEEKFQETLIMAARRVVAI